MPATTPPGTAPEEFREWPSARPLPASRFHQSIAHNPLRVRRSTRSLCSAPRPPHPAQAKFAPRKAPGCIRLAPSRLCPSRKCVDVLAGCEWKTSRVARNPVDVSRIEPRWIHNAKPGSEQRYQREKYQNPAAKAYGPVSSQPPPRARCGCGLSREIESSTATELEMSCMD